MNTRQYKRLRDKKENLRGNMGTTEIVLNMLWKHPEMFPGQSARKPLRKTSRSPVRAADPQALRGGRWKRMPANPLLLRKTALDFHRLIRRCHGRNRSFAGDRSCANMDRLPRLHALMPKKPNASSLRGCFSLSKSPPAAACTRQVPNVCAKGRKLRRPAPEEASLLWAVARKRKATKVRSRKASGGAASATPRDRNDRENRAIRIH